MLDSLLVSLKTVCQQLLPIFGAAALFYLCIVLKHASKLVDAITDTVKALDPTLKKVDLSMEKVQAPLDTVVRLSHTMDNVHDKTVESVSRAAAAANENIEKIKEAVAERVGGNSGEAEEKTDE
ncbi:MAG: hypothetical protein K6D03_04345 [Solobacterium sp.]|nr:hypothetical protein [Solobacterium sp.]